MTINRFEDLALPETTGIRPDFPPIDVTNLPAYEYLGALYSENKIRAQEAVSSLNLAIKHGFIDPRRPLDMLDWGSSEGPSTLPLVRLADLNNGEVTAVEGVPAATQTLIEANVLPPDHVVTGEGVNFLNEATAAGRRFDLITACMFGADHSGKLAKSFVPAAVGNLSEVGKLIVYSDYHTMASFEDVCRQADINYQLVQAQLDDRRPTRRIIIAGR